MIRDGVRGAGKARVPRPLDAGPDWDSVLLLIDPAKGHVFPFSPRGLDAVTRPPAAIRRDNADTLFLDRRGQVYRLGAIDLRRTSWLARLGLYFGFPMRADIRLDPVTMPLDPFRELLILALDKARTQMSDDEETWWLLTAPPDEVRAEIGRAESLSDLHARLRFPDDADCLDLL